MTLAAVRPAWAPRRCLLSDASDGMPTEKLPEVRLKIERRSSHPWIFQKMVDKPTERLPGGTVVDIVDRAGQWVGRGLYDGHSRIALRVLTADQRDNRRDLAGLCRGKRVLDLCCNTGGFAVYAKALGQAEDVVGVDLDEQVIALAKQNANLNQARVRFVQADLFAWLRDIVPTG